MTKQSMTETLKKLYAITALYILTHMSHNGRLVYHWKHLHIVSLKTSTAVTHNVHKVEDSSVFCHMIITLLYLTYEVFNVQLLHLKIIYWMLNTNNHNYRVAVKIKTASQLTCTVVYQ